MVLGGLSYFIIVRIAGFPTAEEAPMDGGRLW
jgi:hypothetical protein